MEHPDCSIRRGSGGLGPGRATVPSLEEVALVLPTAGLAHTPPCTPASGGALLPGLPPLETQAGSAPTPASCVPSGRGRLKGEDLLVSRLLTKAVGQ